jgi:hypothetical protein
MIIEPTSTQHHKLLKKVMLKGTGHNRINHIDSLEDESIRAGSEEAFEKK